METKVMDSIPENLKETLIQEVQEIINERELSEKTEKIKPASTKELEEVVKHLKI